MLTKDEIYQTLDYKYWKCAHEVNQEIAARTAPSLDSHPFLEFVQRQPENVLPQIERYLSSFVDEKVAEARKRQQRREQIQLCGPQQGELEYRLVPQEVKLKIGAEYFDSERNI